MKGFEKCKWEYSCGYKLCMPEFCKEYEAVPMTNADHIRSMSDEELADLLYNFGMSNLVERGKTETAMRADKYHIELWLKQPYKENEE